jgi:ribose 1,5-bisphosphate isomerase
MTLEYVSEVSERIQSMEIRGAGKIARSAAEALRVFASESSADDAQEFLEGLREAGDVLISSRPSAVSLPNAVKYILYRVENSKVTESEDLRKIAINAANEFIENSLEAVDKIGLYGAKRIDDGDTVMTHCNSSAAIEVIKSAWGEGKDIKVIASEARPRYQGHITVRELTKEGIPTTLIVDSAVRAVMKKVNKVVVGADSIAANGAVINKIGTSQIALSAQEARVLFFVAAETYKFHPETCLGDIVEIEERDPAEVADPKEFEGITIKNLAFDVTPPEYIDLIVTEKGVIPPQAAIMVIKEEFGWAVGDRW